MIRAYLVDDEEHALNLLEVLLLEIGGVEVVGRSGDPQEALVCIRTIKPDLVFLDIEMPGMYGIELAERIKSDLPDTSIVFVTAHNEHAIAAFEHDASDYLLKPPEEARLSKTVQRIRKKLAASIGPLPANRPEPRLLVRLLGGFEVYNGELEPLRWHTAKVKELFAYLLLQTGEGVHKDRIIDALWESEHYQKSKVYLHTCISYLRKDLSRCGLTGIITYKDEKYYLDQISIESDLSVLRNGLLLAHQLYSKGDIAQLEAALALYRGPLLLHYDYNWALEETERLHRQWMDARLAMASYLHQQGEHRKAIDMAELLLFARPYDESAYHLLIACYKTIGKHDEAIRISRSLVEMLLELQEES
ncbi:response regulator [Paenibacillus sp. FSL H8-0034]|uniref:response regulator n=1 Tax=Paenibacillus sp. FSL H8-0034 TaxID=2954671 RepID=UPI0030F9DF14